METEEIVLLVLYGIGYVGALLLCLLPSIIALKKRHPKKKYIILVNIFLGYTVFGWVVSFLWATSKVKNDVIASEETVTHENKAIDKPN